MQFYISDFSFYFTSIPVCECNLQSSPIISFASDLKWFTWTEVQYMYICCLPISIFLLLILNIKIITHENTIHLSSNTAILISTNLLTMPFIQVVSYYPIWKDDELNTI